MSGGVVSTGGGGGVGLAVAWQVANSGLIIQMPTSHTLYLEHVAVSKHQRSG